MFEREPYRSILNLLIEFQNHKGGLEQKHFRYALIKGYDVENLHDWTIKEMEGFFGDKLKFMFNNDYIKPGCVSSKNNLNKFLNTLLNLRIIKRNNRGKKSLYKIERSYALEGYRLQNIEILNMYPKDSIWVIDNKTYPLRFVLYGFSKELIDSLTTEDKRKLNDFIINIEENISDIELIKTEKVQNDWIKKFDYMVNKYNNKKFKVFIFHLPIALLMILIDEIQGHTLRDYSVITEDTDKYKLYIKLVNDFIHKWSDSWFIKSCGLPLDEANEFLEVMRKETRRIYNLWCIPGIAFSRYYIMTSNQIEDLISKGRLIDRIHS